MYRSLNFQDGITLGESRHWKCISEEDIHTLVLYEAQAGDSGRYTCVAVNSAGGTSSSASLTIDSMCHMIFHIQLLFIPLDVICVRCEFPVYVENFLANCLPLAFFEDFLLFLNIYVKKLSYAIF